MSQAINTQNSHSHIKTEHLKRCVNDVNINAICHMVWLIEMCNFHLMGNEEGTMTDRHYEKFVDHDDYYPVGQYDEVHRTGWLDEGVMLRNCVVEQFNKVRHTYATYDSMRAEMERAGMHYIGHEDIRDAYCDAIFDCNDVLRQSNFDSGTLAATKAKRVWDMLRWHEVHEASRTRQKTSTQHSQQSNMNVHTTTSHGRTFNEETIAIDRRNVDKLPHEVRLMILDQIYNNAIDTVASGPSVDKHVEKFMKHVWEHHAGVLNHNTCDNCMVILSMLSRGFMVTVRELQKVIDDNMYKHRGLWYHASAATVSTAHGKPITGDSRTVSAGEHSRGYTVASSDGGNRPITSLRGIRVRRDHLLEEPEHEDRMAGNHLNHTREANNMFRGHDCVTKRMPPREESTD